MQVTALSNIGHNNQEYVKGDILDVTEAQAQALIEAGAAVSADESSSEGESTDKTPATEQTREQELLGQTRADLNDLAGTLDLDTADKKAFPNKQSVVDAILATESGDSSEGDDTEDNEQE